MRILYNMFNQSQLFKGIEPQAKQGVHISFFPQEKYTGGMANYKNSINWEHSKEYQKSVYTTPLTMGKRIAPAFTPTNFIGIKEIRGWIQPDLSKQITCGFDKLNTSKQKLTDEQLIKHPKNPYKFSA